MPVSGGRDLSKDGNNNDGDFQWSISGAFCNQRWRYMSLITEGSGDRSPNTLRMPVSGGRVLSKDGNNNDGDCVLHSGEIATVADVDTVWDSGISTRMRLHQNSLLQRFSVHDKSFNLRSISDVLAAAEVPSWHGIHSKT